MFSRILIANRGEIALRIIRTCKRLGVETVVVYSTADKDAVYLKMADKAICIGPGQSKDSYLNQNAIIAAAEIGDVEAIHPGYGFLSENSEFADKVRSCQIAFIGPPTEVISSLGDKIKAKEIARRARVPTVPGSEGALSDDKHALEVAEKIGFPVLLKAAAGGGGRGMRVAHNPITLKSSFQQAYQEAEAAFGDGRLYMEKYIESMRHVEVQIIADKKTVLHLGERDCTIQRRNQKLIEETPCPVIDRRTQYDIRIAAVNLLKEAKYTNAGTVEFIYDLKDRKFYFMEVNTRLQVEHPVTEMVTGLDLVELQLRVASGQRLEIRQKEIDQRLKAGGHAIECRINAEDPTRGFAPCPGTISMYCPPQGSGIRMDSHIYSGYKVPPYYDSMLGKLIVHGRDPKLDPVRARQNAIKALRNALHEMVLDGISTTLPLLKEISGHSAFVGNNYDTSFISSEMNL